MAFGKIPRIKRFSSSSTCSRVTIVLFFAFSLVGVWMLTSWTVVPTEFYSLGTRKSELQKHVSHSDSRSLDLEDRSGKAFTNSNMSSSHNWDDSRTDKIVESNSKASEMNVGDQGVDDIIKQDVEENANQAEKKTIVHKPNGIMNSQESNSSVSIKHNSNAGQQEINKKSSNQRKNNDGYEMNGEKNNLHTEDFTKEGVFTVGSQSELLNETNTQAGAWSTQAIESRNEKELQLSSSKGEVTKYKWKLCNVTAEADYIPCLDNEEAIKRLPDTMHYEHRERHCPEKTPTCLAPLPNGYRMPIKWPNSRDKIWFYNVPHMKLVEYKGHQNWLRFSGEYLTFPGGGTQFKFGASHYIDIIQKDKE